MMRTWVVRAPIFVGLALLAACATTPPSTSQGADLLAVEAKEFKETSDSALQQLLGQSTTGVIPAAKLLEISRLVDTRVMELTSQKADTLPPREKMFVLEASQLIELSDIENTGSTVMKGLIVMAAPTDERSFDWTAVAVVDMKTWDVLDLRLNKSFGKFSRNFDRKSKKEFVIMNDYLGAIYGAKDVERYVTPYHLKRVFVPKKKGDKLDLKQMDRLYAYIPNQQKEKRFVLDAELNVYQLSTAQLGRQSLSADHLVKVGELR